MPVTQKINPEQRVGVLIDIQNLYYSARILYKKKVNFNSAVKEAVGDRKLIRAIAYGIKTIENLEKNFFEALNKGGIEVKTKDLQIFPDNSKKGDWDVGIAVDAIKLSKNLDVIILMSGDGDFIPLMEYLQGTTGCRVEIVTFAESASAKLIEKADSFINLSTNKKKFLLPY